MSSIKRIAAPRKAAPPTQIARVLSQQQLVPTTKAIALPKNDFL